MKTNCVTAREKLREKTGMTLTEVLVALAVLSIAIMCFLPLAQSSFKNIYTVGEATKSNYRAVGLIERLIGNNGANGAYEVSTDNVPLQMKVKNIAIQANDGTMQSINGASIVSKPENAEAGFSTFICDSVTAKMVCYPSHIADDFLTKTITLYAAGFRFSDVSEFQLSYTDSTGTLQTVPGGTYNDSNPYCRIKIDKDNASIAYLTLVGDNNYIRFENSPLHVKYRVYELDIEIDAPTVIMVGEEAADGNYYYYVTSGEPDEDGNLDIVRKKMNSVDPLGRISGNITLSSAMNDVEWVAAGEGDNGAGGVNQYGYYVMCGDNGQIRRFWKNPATGNYGWGGDYTFAHEYYYNGDESSTPTVTDSRMYNTTVDSSYVYIKDPTKNIANKQDPGDTDAYGINLVPRLDPKVMDYPIYDTLYTQTAFTVNALNKHPDIEVYTAGNLLWGHRITAYPNLASEYSDMADKYINDSTDDTKGWTYYFANGGGDHNILRSGNRWLKTYPLKRLNATQKLRAADMVSYKDYYGLDADTTNCITLTSVDSVTMQNTYTSVNKHPTSSYTLYCGYIPAVMDLWATNLGVARFSEYNFGEWRATLGLAFQDNSANGYFDQIGDIYHGVWVTGKNKEWHNHLTGYLWEYGRATSKNYSLSGICGPKNYAEENNRALKITMDLAKLALDYGRKYYPLNTWDYQAEIQNMNTTDITVSYLSNPYAFSNAKKWHNIWDQSPDRRAYGGVFEWAFDDSMTVMDSDSLYYEDYDGNAGYYSIAVGYYVGGLVYENQDNKMITSPTVMNIGKVYLRAGGANDNGLGDGYKMQQESNVFNEFYTTNDYWYIERGIVGTKNTMHQSVSASYWRDCYHPLFYSNYGGAYNPNDGRDKYSYIMSHALQDKKLTSVSWGMTYNESPEAMWGASDGTLMSWFLDLNAVQKGESGVRYPDSDPIHKYSANKYKQVYCEFQSYRKLLYNNNHLAKYGTREFAQRWQEGALGKTGKFELPLTTDDMSNWMGGDSGVLASGHNNGSDTNSYWDKCSIQLGKMSTLGFISPLDTITDVAYANDTWVACGVQGAANPRYYNGIELCKQAAVVKKTGASDEGSWVCVRSWYDQSGGTDAGPCEGNSNFVWQAVQISQIKNCNIQQVTYCNGMWYAVGYIDTNDNGQYDYTVESGQQREHAVVFYAVDPAQPCGTEQGWRLSDNGHVGYTQAYANDGSGNYSMMNIDGVNSVASRND